MQQNGFISSSHTNNDWQRSIQLTSYLPCKFDQFYRKYILYEIFSHLLVNQPERKFVAHSMMRSCGQWSVFHFAHSVMRSCGQWSVFFLFCSLSDEKLWTVECFLFCSLSDKKLSRVFFILLTQWWEAVDSGVFFYFAHSVMRSCGQWSVFYFAHSVMRSDEKLWSVFYFAHSVMRSCGQWSVFYFAHSVKRSCGVFFYFAHSVMRSRVVIFNHCVFATWDWSNACSFLSCIKDWANRDLCPASCFLCYLPFRSGGGKKASVKPYIFNM